MQCNVSMEHSDDDDDEDDDGDDDDDDDETEMQCNVSMEHSDIICSPVSEFKSTIPQGQKAIQNQICQNDMIWCEQNLHAKF